MRFRNLAIASLAFAGLVGMGCEKRAPTADDQAKGYVPSTTPADRVPSTLDRENVSGRDIYIVGDDGTRHMLHDSVLLTQVQQKLASAGVYKGATDGTSSPELATAIRDYQKQQGLSETGSIDRRTADALGLDWSRISENEKTLGSEMRKTGTEIENKAKDVGSDIKAGAEKAGTEIEKGANKASDEVKEGARDVKRSLDDQTK